MDTRGAIQLLSCFVVISIVIYHFELGPRVTITWEDGNQAPPAGAITPRVNEALNNPGNAEHTPDHKLPTENNKDKLIFVQPPRELTQTKGSAFLVILPTSLAECFPAEIAFRSENSFSYEEQLELIEHLFVELECTNPLTKQNFRKYLPVVPTNSQTLQTYFYPDDSTSTCTITAKSTSGITLEGKTTVTLSVNEIPPERPWCWNCEPLIFRDIPMAYHFLLTDENGKYLFSRSSISIERNEILRLWIVPHPLTSRYYPSVVDKVFFNAWLRNTHIIQGVDVSPTFDVQHQGYEVTIVGRDGGALELNILLNWYYPFSELGSSEPAPILSGSHIEHSYSFCDAERSEIFGSAFPIHVQVENANELFIIPDNPKKCLKVDEPGRWLNVIPRETACRPPYCTGDRFETFVSTMSWQGTKHEWLWIPYNCHYHYYSVDDFTSCAAKKNIKWIHVMGDSLPREIVAYLMSYNEMVDTTKFEHADVLLEGSGVRLTFSIFADAVLRGPGKDVWLDTPRDKKFIEHVVDQYNVRTMNSSQGFDNEAYDIHEPAEQNAPDIFILNGATAYSLFLQTKRGYEHFINDFADVLGRSLIDGRHGDGKKVKMYWYGNPYLHGTAHEGTEYITQPRCVQFNEISKPILEKVGVKQFDFIHISQMRPEESWDGLHYLRGYEHWNGHVAATYIQSWLNELFGECTGA